MSASSLEQHIRLQHAYIRLSPNLQKEYSEKEYEKQVLCFSIRNQLRYRTSLVGQMRKISEKKYYEELMEHSRDRLMLFPYHLSDVVVRGLGVTPFVYYVNILQRLVETERSYDSLPNFTAADCLRLVGVGRNEYIDVMNRVRSSGHNNNVLTNSSKRLMSAFFSAKKADIREIVPKEPPENGVNMQPWWIAHVAHVTEEQAKRLAKDEHAAIDALVEGGSCPAGHVDYNTLYSLYKKGLVYLDVPVEKSDHVVMPPLQGFVMNRVSGDAFETLLYKIFVSIDENTSIEELSKILEIDVSQVRDAVSLYCRLGFARKKRSGIEANDIHPSWYEHVEVSFTEMEHHSVSSDEEDSLLRELRQELEDEPDDLSSANKDDDDVSQSSSKDSTSGKRVAFLFDSTLTAYLMMGNLTPGLKNHAVTLFEAGKLCDESLDSLTAELEKVSNNEGEGEAARYFSHALTLGNTINFIRNNLEPSNLETNGEGNKIGLDLIRCESLQSLDSSTAARLLNKNYGLLVSMAPLYTELRPLGAALPPHLGPASPEVSSIWFKMFLYHILGNGPPSLLMAKGTQLNSLPEAFGNCDRWLVTTWGHDPAEISVQGGVANLHDAVQHAPVLLQAMPSKFSKAANKKDTSSASESERKEENEEDKVFVAFPLLNEDRLDTNLSLSLERLRKLVDVEHNCGYVTFLQRSKQCHHDQLPSQEHFEPKSSDEADNIDTLMESDKHLKLSQVDNDDDRHYVLLDVSFGVPLFSGALNKDICDRVVKAAICNKSSLESLALSNESLCGRLLDFISKFHENEPQSSFKLHPTTKIQDDNSLTMPTQSLYFDGSEVGVWTG